MSPTFTDVEKKKCLHAQLHHTSFFFFLSLFSNSTVYEQPNEKRLKCDTVFVPVV